MAYGRPTAAEKTMAKFLKHRIKIFGRAVPVAGIVAAGVTIAAAAGFLLVTMSANVTSFTTAKGLGPVNFRDTSTIANIGNAVCSKVAGGNLGDDYITISASNVSPGEGCSFTLPLKNRNTTKSVTILPPSGNPPEVDLIPPDDYVGFVMPANGQYNSGSDVMKIVLNDSAETETDYGPFEIVLNFGP
jgi:hypothetical protein